MNSSNLFLSVFFSFDFLLLSDKIKLNTRPKSHLKLVLNSQKLNFYLPLTHLFPINGITTFQYLFKKFLMVIFPEFLPYIHTLPSEITTTCGSKIAQNVLLYPGKAAFSPTFIPR